MIFKRKGLASKLKHQLVLEQQQHTIDAMGGHSNSWVEVATLWAEIIPISGRESFLAKQLNNQQRVRITLRYRDSISTSMRLRDNSTNVVYNIKSVIDVNKDKRMIEIMADVYEPAESY